MQAAGLWYDAATAQSLGQRALQEDAIIAHFPQGTTGGFAVLADGMGGHAAGDVAARIVLTEVFSDLLLRSGDPELPEADLPAVLRETAGLADQCLAAHVAGAPDTLGMGATLVVPLIRDGALWWISIGDSPLYLYRDRRLSQLNEDHSLAPQIDLMIQRGLISPDVGRRHPDRNVLTSVLHGQRIARIDCPEAPLRLKPGDILIVASDGIQSIDEDRLAAICAAHLRDPAFRLTAALLGEIERMADPDQDNASCAVIRVLPRRSLLTGALRRFRRAS